MPCAFALLLAVAMLLLALLISAAWPADMISINATAAPWLLITTKWPTSGVLLLLTPPAAAELVATLMVDDDVVPVVLDVANGLATAVVKAPFHCIWRSIVV